MAGSGDIDDVGLRLADQAIQVDVDEILSGRSAPVSQQARFDVGFRERLAQQRIIQQVDLPDAEIICGVPVALHLVEQFRGERARCGRP